jgi:hypothetical protein
VLVELADIEELELLVLREVLTLAEDEVLEGEGEEEEEEDDGLDCGALERLIDRDERAVL